MNDTHVTITGWVGTDVTLTRVAGGQQVASFRVATTPRRWQDGEWRDGATLWVQVKAWRRLAGHVARSVHSGDPVVVSGRLVADVWEKDDGTMVTTYELVAGSVGHDLSWGTSTFARAQAETRGGAPGPQEAGPEAGPESGPESAVESVPAVPEEGAPDREAA
jgi:single-strand DNA-binding protein